jgi:hypothetical protein
MQTPSRRISTAAFFVAALTIAFSFFFVSNRTFHTASSKTVAQAKSDSPKSSVAVSTSLKQHWLETYGRLPLAFEANEGQSPAGIQFLSRGEGYDLSLMSREADLTLRQPAAGGSSAKRPARFGGANSVRVHNRPRSNEKQSELRMRLAGSNPDASLTGVERTGTKINYFIGNDPKKWHTDVPAYAKVKYGSVYPGVDLIFYGNQGEFEYDFVVAPGADPKVIALNIEGASKMRLDARGNLIMSLRGGAVELKKPNVYQEINGARREVVGNYTIATNHEVRFALANYDRTQPLTIDPVVTYATYFGGSGNANGGDAGSAIALDAAGDAYITGTTSSADLVLKNNGITGVPGSVTSGSTTAFVAELNPTGTASLYVTYLGGSTADGGDAIAVDAGNNVYLTGFTESTDFPVNSTNAPFQAVPPASVGGGFGSAFVTRLNPALAGIAQLVYSTYLGGDGSANGGDEGHGIAVDGNGDAFVTGETFSPTNFPTKNATAPFTSTLTSPLSNTFVAEIDTNAASTASLMLLGYFGGTGAGVPITSPFFFPFGDLASGIAIDSTSNVYIVGTTTSKDFPTQGAQISACNIATNNTAAFLSVINVATPAAPTLVYSTCMAGDTAENGNAIALGPNNIAYLTGGTFSSAGSFPLTTNTIPLGFPGAPPPGVPNANSPVAFVSTVNTSTGALTYSTLLGGNNGDVGFGIAVDAQGIAYVVGQTSSGDFPLTLGALQITNTNAAGTAFVSKVNASAGGHGGQDLLYSTYFGGNGDPNNPNGADPDAANGVVVAGTNAFVTGQATPGLSTTAGAYQPTTKNVTGLNAFVADLPLVPTLTVDPTVLAFGTQLLNTSTAPMTVTVTNNSSGTLTIPYVVVGANSTDFVSSPDAASGCTNGMMLAAGASCTIDVVFTPTFLPVGAEAATLQIANSLNPTQPFTVALTGTGSATADFSLTVPATANLMSGVAGSIPIMVNGIGGLTDPVTLSCTAGTMNVSSCTVSPTSVAPGATATASVTATVSFVAPPATIKAPPPASIRQVVFLILGISMLFMIPMTQRFRMRMGMAAAMLVFIAVAGCSGSPSSHTTSGSVTITGTGTGAAAGITHSATVNLTISK